MGRYGNLTAGEGHLSFYTELDASRVAESEAMADVWINEEYHRYDRTTWSLAGRPPGIGVIWLKMASGEYILLDASDANPFGPEGRVETARTMKEEAMIFSDRMKAQGFLTGVGGGEERPVGGGGASSLNVEVAV